MRRWLALTCLLLLGRAASAAVVVHEAWVPEAPPGARVLAAYLDIENASDSTRTLLGVSSGAARAVEIHRSEIDQGMARMRRLEVLELPAGSRTRFAPGGLHLMLLEPVPLTAGAEVPLTLRLDDGTELAVKARVRARDQAGHDGH